MKNFSVKIISFLLLAIIIVLFCGCSMFINPANSIDVCSALSDKYNESFQAVSVGDRFNTNTSKYYIHPSDNPELLFVARINNDTGLVEDNYIEERVNYQIEGAIQSTLEEIGMESKARCFVVTQEPLVYDDLYYTPSEFASKYSIEHYSVYLIVNQDSYDSAKFKDQINSVCNTFDIKLLVTTYGFLSPDYEACLQEMNKYPDISLTMIEKHNPEFMFDEFF